MVKIKKAEYILSAAWKSQWPEESFPEMCLAGRSNVGKSSFINTMLSRNGLAKVSSTPGKTMDEYISERQTLRGFILLVDYRHKPTKDDVMMYEFVKHHGVPVIVVATKEDKLKRNDLKKNEKLIKDTLHFDPSDTFIRFSSLKKKGIQEAWNAIYELCDLDFE